MRIILASSSPRRQQLLKSAGYDLKIVAPHADETLHPNELPDVYVRRLALAKAQIVSKDVELPVIAADTVVVLASRILGKPNNENEAREMLRQLSGCEHQVLTGFAVTYKDNVHVEVVATNVFFRPLTDHEIETYLITKEPFDKAGSYAIQGVGAFLIDRVEGSLTNVVGLPLKEVIESLQRLVIEQGHP